MHCHVVAHNTSVPFFPSFYICPDKNKRGKGEEKENSQNLRKRFSRAFAPLETALMAITLSPRNRPPTTSSLPNRYHSPWLTTITPPKFPILHESHRIIPITRGASIFAGFHNFFSSAVNLQVASWILPRTGIFFVSTFSLLFSAFFFRWSANMCVCVCVCFSHHFVVVFWICFCWSANRYFFHVFLFVVFCIFWVDSRCCWR